MMLLYVSLLTVLVHLTSASQHHAALHSHHKITRQSTTSSTAQSNGVMLQSFGWYLPKDNRHWINLNTQLAKLANIGVDRLWIPPATKAATNASVGYDVYDLWDLGEFNQKGQTPTSYGTKDELKELSQNASTFGITILADAVMNQRNGADSTIDCQAYKVDPNNRLQSISGNQTIAAYIGFQFPGRGTTYSNKTYGCDDFTAVSFDNITQQDAIWKLVGNDNAFALDVSQENGNYDFLIMDDVAFENPSIQADVKAWAKWYIQEIGLSGFRFDAAKHISRAFQLDLINEINKDNLLYIAEYLASDVSLVQTYLDGVQGKVSVFDTPLQQRLHQFSTGQLSDLRTVLNYTWLSTNPSKSVPYVMNHDTQIGQALESSNISGWFLPLAYALILLRQEGYPTIFWGDVYGQHNSSGAFFPPPYGKDIANLALARKLYSYGPQVDYFNGANSIGWVRQGDASTNHTDGLAVLLNNAQGVVTEIRMNVGPQHRGEAWTSVLFATNEVTIDNDGWGLFNVSAGTVNVYANKNAPGRDLFGQWDYTI